MSEQFKSIETTELVKIANAIRTKTGSNEQITLKDMPDKIRSIEGGGIYLPELEFEGSSTDLLAGKQLIDSEGNIVTGTIPTKTNNNLTIEGANITVPKGYYESDVVAEMPTTTQATPTISVNSAGKITATASQSAGYIEAGTKTTTHQLDAQAAQTITPSTQDKTIAAGKYLTGTQTIKGDANLKAENIAEGVSIFGVAGTHAGDSGGVVLPTLTNEGAASDLLSGKQLIDSDGNIVEGTIATKSASNLTANGATVTVPAGYYASQATKSVATATQATPSVSINSSGLITASATQSEGYVTAGTRSETKQLTTQAATTITPSKSSQTAVAKDVYTTGVITVEAIPDDYITTTDATATSSDILSGKTAYVDGEKVTGTIATKTSSNLTASGATVTVPAGYYASQTTKSVATATQATPSITINASGLITATATQTAGYVAAGTKSGTKQLAFQAAKTITPSTASQIAVSSGYYTGGNITVAAVPTQSKTITPTSTAQNVTPDSGKFLSKVTVNGDSDLVAGNIKSGVNIFGVTGTYVGSGGGDTSAEDGLVTKNLTSYTNNRVTSIGSYAFQYCSLLTSVNFPNATTIGNSAFAYCSKLTSVSFPKVTSIGNSAFAYCSKLTSVSFPACKTIAAFAFDSCYSLTTANFPVCTTVNYATFYKCSRLATISFPKCTLLNSSAFCSCAQLVSVDFPVCSYISSAAFEYCISLATANFPACTTLARSAFTRCSKLVSVSLPVCTSIDQYAFLSCCALTSISLPACSYINNYAFFQCSALSKIYLNNSSVCTLAHSKAFSKAGIWSNKGSIYVPSSLVASYKAATNWAFFSKRIYGI